MEIFTIGFTKKTAKQFFEILRKHGITRLIDVRLNNVSQLAGFTKRDDLEFFLREICNADYVHEPLLAPTQELLDKFKKEKGDWSEYERQFLALMAAREIESRVARDLFSGKAVMLCSEPTPEHCHRRLVAEYLQCSTGQSGMQGIGCLVDACLGARSRYGICALSNFDGAVVGRYPPCRPHRDIGRATLPCIAC